MSTPSGLLLFAPKASLTLAQRIAAHMGTVLSLSEEREFDAPARFDVTRVPERQVYFGHGHHVCLGKSLARLESSARPQSSTSTSPKAPTITLAGFRSRCTMPRSCA